jgi:H+/gluconate symporter-like permease
LVVFEESRVSPPYPSAHFLSFITCCSPPPPPPLAAADAAAADAAGFSMASYAPAMQFSQAFALIEKQATRWYQSEPFTMKFSSQKKAVASVVAASIVLGLVLVALSSNSASNQVNFLNRPVFFECPLAHALLVSFALCAGGGVVRPLVVYGGAHPCSPRHLRRKRFPVPLMIYAHPPYISRIA